jgi:hypothetical protein
MSERKYRKAQESFDSLLRLSSVTAQGSFLVETFSGEDAPTM